MLSQNRLKKGWEREKIKIIVPFRSNHIRNAKFQNTIMASCQANIGWKSKRKRENKYYHFVPFLPDT